MKPMLRGLHCIAVAAVGIPFFAACSSDPTAASDVNFSKALNEMLAARSCIELPRNFDVKAPALPLMRPGEPEPILKELAGVGVFTTRPAMVTAQLGGQIPGTRFEVAPRGREVIRTKRVSTAIGESETAEACIGRYEVTEVTGSTEPAERLGYKVVDVTYRYRWVDFPAWASGLMAEKEADGQVLLAATSEGWVPASSIQGR